MQWLYELEGEVEAVIKDDSDLWFIYWNMKYQK
jgi:hypothetical protein